MNDPRPAAVPGSSLSKSFLVIALVEGTVLAAAVLLLALDVIPFGVFIGVVAVCVAGTGIAILNVVRRGQQTAKATGAGSGSTSATDAGSTGPGSTIDPSNPFTH